MKLVLGALIAIAPLSAHAADTFGSQGTFLPKGGVYVTHQRFNGLNGGESASFTSIAVAPELGYFLIDNLALFGSLQLSATIFNGEPSFGYGGGLGLGYHVPLVESVGLLPAIDLAIHQNRSRAFSSTGLVARARLPIVFTRQNFYFGVGPEAHWYEPILNDPNTSAGSLLLGLFTEIGGWL